MRGRISILMSALASVALLGCDGKRLNVGNDVAGGGHAGRGGGQAGAAAGAAGNSAGAAGTAAGAAGSIMPAGSGGAGGPGGTTGTGGAAGIAGAAGQAGGGGGGALGSGLSVDPTSATFASTPVEAVSAPQVFTVRNDGSATTTLAALGGINAPDFLISSNGCGATLQPGASCPIAVAFAPKIRSGSRSASLDVSAPSGMAVNVSLTGNALAALGLLAGGLGGDGSLDGTGAAARFFYPVGIAGDGAGNLYVADFHNYLIRKVAIATGTVTTLAGTAHEEGIKDGIGASAGFGQMKDLTSDGAGNLYVIDGTAIRKVVVATGAVTTLADDAGVAVQVDGPSGIAHDGAGYLYVTRLDTNDSSRGTIRKIAVATGTVTTLADRTGVNLRFSSPYAIASDGGGNLYVVDGASIRKIVIATAATTTLAGAFGEAGRTDGIGAAARFSEISGLHSDGAGNLYVAEGVNSDVGRFIRKVVIATGAVTSVAGTPGQSGSADGIGAAARFAYPKAMASDGAGNLYVTDVYNNAIRRVVVATGAVTTLAGLPGQPSTVDGIGAAARFEYPRSVATDGAGNLYVTEGGLIRKVVVTTGATTTLASGLLGPTGIVGDGAGNLYFADGTTVRRIVIATRAVTTLAGAADQWGSADGTGAAARFTSLCGIASDGAGNLYVTDSSDGTIRKIVIASRAVTTFAGTAGEVGAADGTGAAARFYGPCGIASDGVGNLYVADSANATVRRIVIATRAVTTLAGVAQAYGSADGMGQAARFSSPYALASDNAGNLYVTDYATIRKIAIDTATVSTVIGAWGRNGVALGALPASINGPVGIVMLPTGQLAVVDTLENAVLIGHL